MGGYLSGRRAVVTEADDFMGPAIAQLFREEGAVVVEDRRDLSEPAEAEKAIRAAGHVDVLIINLSIPNPRALAHETSDEQWDAVYRKIVHPTHRLVRAVLPQMIERQSGKIVVIGSASALRGTPNRSCYGSARGAQHAYVRNVGIEVAPCNVQVNATGQIYVENPTYFPPERLSSERLAEELKAVPAGRVATGREAAEFVLFLSGPESDFISGQVFAYSGGWVHA
ncbi:SDR family NAD(P)-dependent oxidoreductase [Aestuariivirga sp.]|uniref:SDR family NAD(P)-dependent oxidoreductase n=1 Tax=Aestuariivirga sp. TaxID=2650926 RepID=UPI00391CC929